MPEINTTDIWAAPKRQAPDPAQIALAAEVIAAMARELSDQSDQVALTWQQIAAEMARAQAMASDPSSPLTQVTGALSGAGRALAMLQVAIRRHAAAQRLPAWLPVEFRVALASMVPARLLPPAMSVR